MKFKILHDFENTPYLTAITPTPQTNKMPLYDFIIIGSGVSGGKWASMLTEAGAKCLLLEAGQEFAKNTFPVHEIDYSSQMFWGGGVEANEEASMFFLRAKVLGGTSIVNQALLDRFDDLALDDWKDRSGIAYLNTKDLEAHYQACERAILTGTISEKYYNPNAKYFVKGFDALHLGWKPLVRAQGDCKLDCGSDCIVCLGGCRRDSKQSSLVTGIRQARTRGLKTLTGVEVIRVDHHSDHVDVIANYLGEKTRFTAPKVVLACGSFGNTKLLLQSGFKLPALGKGFSCHPQFMNYGVFDEPVNAHKGALQSVKSSDSKIRQAGFKFENVFAPPIGTSVLMPGIGIHHQELMMKYRYVSSIEVAVRDEPSGEMHLGRGGKFLISKRLTSQDSSRIKQGLALMEEVFLKSGAKDVIHCTQAFGLHLMGGCALGTEAHNSVVDPEFKVHDNPRLFCADSSIFPSAPGINPSFTIMALTHRAAETVLRAS